jgi:hypothetical protein
MDSYTIERRVVISYTREGCKGVQHWVPDVKTENDIDYLLLTPTDGGLTRFCALRNTLKDIKDANSNEDMNMRSPWESTTFFAWVRELRKKSIDEQILNAMRERNNACDMKLPNKFARTKESVDKVCQVTLPEVAFGGELCEAFDTHILTATDNRETIGIELTETLLKWLAVAAKSRCPDPDEEELNAAPDRRRRSHTERMKLPEEFKGMVRHMRYDRSQIIGKYVNADGVECYQTLKPLAWEPDAIAYALRAFAEWRKLNHFVKINGAFMLDPAVAQVQGN